MYENENQNPTEVEIQNPTEAVNYNTNYNVKTQSEAETISLICGIVGIMCTCGSCCLSCFGPIANIIGIIVGIAAVIFAFTSKRETGKYSEVAMIGLVLGCFSIIASVLLILFWILVVVLQVVAIPAGAYYDSYNNYF